MRASQREELTVGDQDFAGHHDEIHLDMVRQSGTICHQHSN